jgi:hypothetical protein
MKFPIFFAVLTLMISACSAAPAYKAAHYSGYGYQDYPLAEDRYRVSFKARGDDRHAAMDYALRRAAEVTLLEGYDWFIVVDRETSTDREISHGGGFTMQTTHMAVRDCGVLGCSTNYYPSYSYGMDMRAEERREKVQAVLEIRMGEGARPSEGESYDAKLLVRRLK